MSERIAVYRLYDADDALLYVGVSKNFGLRWQQHATAQPWWPDVIRQTVDWHDTEREALAVEFAAIRDEHPRYNVARTNSHYRSRRNLDRRSAPYMGTAEIARALRVSRQRVQQLAARPAFPAPFEVLAAGKVWKREAVESWARDHGREITAH